MDRRTFLKALGFCAGTIASASLLEACAPATPPVAKPAEAPKATEVPKPAAPSKPAEAAKPAEPAKPAEVAKAPAAPGPSTITVLTFVDGLGGTDSRGAALKEINADFLKKNPNVTVKFEIIPFEQLGPKYMAAFEAGNPPDVTWVRDDFFLRIHGQGGLEDLNQWMGKWPKAEIDDFYNEVGRNRGVVGDKRFLMYTFGSVSGLHYRKDLFEKAGADIKTLTTWDRWIEALQKVTVDKNGKHPNESGFDLNNVDLWGFAEGRLKTKNDFDSQMESSMIPLGQLLLDPQAKANWNNEAGQKAMSLWTDLVVKHKVEPLDDITREVEASNQLFRTGLSASTWLASQRYKDTVDKSSWDGKANLGFMPWPSFDGQKPSPVGTGAWTFGISSKSKNKDVAWSWMEHYLAAESDSIMGRVGGVLPSRLSTLKDPAFNTPEFGYMKEYLAVAAMASFEPSRGRAKITPATELGGAFQEIVANGVPVAEALKASAERFDKASAAV